MLSRKLLAVLFFYRLLGTALSSARLYRCGAGDFCPAGSLYFFSIAGGGGASSAATGGWTLGKETGSHARRGTPHRLCARLGPNDLHIDHVCHMKWAVNDRGPDL